MLSVALEISEITLLNCQVLGVKLDEKSWFEMRNLKFRI